MRRIPTKLCRLFRGVHSRLVLFVRVGVCELGGFPLRKLGRDPVCPLRGGTGGNRPDGTYGLVYRAYNMTVGMGA